MFFSVDVETSGLNPWDGQLLTVGVIPVDPETMRVVDAPFYMRLLVTLHDSWYDESLPAISDTQEFWRQQDQYVKNEAYMDSTLDRKPRSFVAHALAEYVASIEEDWSKRFFVANPAAFDKMWIDWLCANRDQNPFHYRSLCLRSMKYGRTSLQGDFTYGSDRTNHDPEIPHHALSDAYAQALDLISMLTEGSPVKNES